MSWLTLKSILLNTASGATGLAVNWLIQSTLLITIGLIVGWLLRQRGSAVQSAVYRTTLIAVTACPLATWLVALAGFSGWSVAMPATSSFDLLELPAMQLDAAQLSDSGIHGEERLLAMKGRNETTVASSRPFPTELPTDEWATEGVRGNSAAAPPEPPPELFSSLSEIAESDVGESLTIYPFGLAALAASIAWAVVATVLLARLRASSRRVAKLQREALPADRATLDLCRTWATRLGVRPPDVLVSPFVSSPCLAGMRRPTVLLPESGMDLPVRDVLVHELAHMARGDCHWNLVRRAATAVLFFQPLLWRLSRRIETAAEEVCDDFVVAFGGNRGEYAHQLVDFTELTTPRFAAAVGIVSFRSLVGQRVARIMDTSRPLSTRVGGALVALLLAAGLAATLLVGSVGVRPNDAAAQSAASNESQSEADAEAEPTADYRTLQFPAGAPLGVVYVRPAEGHGFGRGEDWYADWEPVGSAQGDVRVKQSDQVRLDISKAASTDLSGLVFLAPDAIDALFLGGTDVTDEQLRDVGHLTGLRYLDLEQTRITDRGTRYLAGLIQLQRLDLSAFDVQREGFGVGDETMRVVSRLPALESIALRLTKVTDAGMRFLAECKSLRSVGIEGTAVTDIGLVHLKELPNLESLSLGVYDEGAKVTDEGVKTIGQMRQLKWLSLCATPVTDAGLLHLAGLDRLESLNLENTAVTNAGLRHLAALPALKRLRAYSLADGEIDDEGAGHLAAIQSLEDITANLQVTDAGVAKLAKLPNLKELSLNGDGERITDAALESIAQMPSLQALWLQDCLITDAGLAHLTKLVGLKRLLIDDVAWTNEGLRRLSALENLWWLSIDLRAGPEGGGARLDLKPVAQLENLTYLTIGGSAITAADLAALSGLDKLETLEIRNESGDRWSVNDEAARHIAKLKSLKSLRIEESIISDAGIAELARLANLEHLTLPALVADEGLLQLTQLERLQMLQVGSPYITDQGVAEMAKKMPSLRDINHYAYRLRMSVASVSKMDPILREGEPKERPPLDAMEYRDPPPFAIENWLNSDGPPLDFERLKGRTVVVFFWQTRSSAFRLALPELKRIYAKYHDQGLEMIGVHVTRRADAMPAYVVAQGIPWPVAADVEGQTQAAWNAGEYLDYYLIDHTGKLRVAGVFRPHIEQAIALLLAEKANGKRVTMEFALQHRRAKAAVDIVYTVLGLDPQQLPAIEGQLGRQRLQLLELLNRNEADVRRVLEVPGPPVYLTFREDRNSLLATATPPLMKKIERIIELLDVPNGEQ